MSKRKFHRTVIQVVVLSETPYEFGSLADTARDITHGDCSGEAGVIRAEEINAHVCARALVRQGSDPSFFLLTEKGEDQD